MERKTKRLWIRISAQDAELIKQKAANYKTVSSMIWDAIKQFDDTGTKRKIAALNEMTALYKKLSAGLGMDGRQLQSGGQACQRTGDSQ